MTRQADGGLLLLETTIVVQVLPGEAEAASARPVCALPFYRGVASCVLGRATTDSPR